jgi:hypothetical protein
VLPDGRRDTETWVAWLQGETHFADLRQAAGRPDMANVASIDDLSDEQVVWLATQEGFSGTLAEDGDCVAWTRLIDFQPPSASPDVARVRLDADGQLVEEGRDAPYVEYWSRNSEPAAAACWGASLIDPQGGPPARLVRAGDRFMFARARSRELPRGARLVDLVREAASLAERRALIDCEISLGRIEARGWRIERSTLPFREGRMISVTASGASLSLSEDGACRVWRIEGSEGSLDFA